MRKLLISILLASAAASPALAQDQGNGRWHRDQQQGDNSQAKDNGQAKEERQQAREEHSQAREQAREERSNGGGNFERQQQAPHERPAPQFEVHQQVQGDPRGGFDRSRFERVNPAPQQVVEQGGEAPRQSFDRGNRGNWNRDRVDQSGERQVRERFGQADGADGSRRGDWNRRDEDLRQTDRPVPNVMRTRNPLIVSTTPREGTQPPLRTEQRRWSGNNWSTDWRRDNRYDWRHWRDRHRSWFHIGIYYDPFGWNYRPYQIGWRLWPSYYGSRYWIEDPWEYRLPYAPPGTVWVRYWDDAILVDRWTGEVVDVIHDFFW